MIEKALASEADMVFLDLEDAVAPAEKAAARANVIAAMQDLDWRGRPRVYRINGLDTPYCYRDLIEITEGTEGKVDLVIVPKVGRPEDVTVVATLLGQLELATGTTRRISIEAQIESASGLVACERIASVSDRLEALIFGPGDFAATVGMPSSAIGTPDDWDARYPGHRWHYAMARIAVAARAGGVRAIDGPYADFRDIDGLRRSCELARALGFDGKWCIHPAQIPIVNEVFTPAEAELAWARRVLAAYEEAAAAGRGAITLDGKMIDAANVRMAQRTLAMAGGREGAGGQTSDA
jgi:citrate lyase subunit beta/citryl-CoA lyase